MATVYKRTRCKPIPAGAEIIYVKGKRFAVWFCRKTKRKVRAALDETGTKVLTDENYYQIAYIDHTGERRYKSSRCREKFAAEQLAKQLETAAMRRREGMIDPAL